MGDTPQMHCNDDTWCGPHPPGTATDTNYLRKLIVRTKGFLNDRKESTSVPSCVHDVLRQMTNHFWSGPGVYTRGCGR